MARRGDHQIIQRQRKKGKCSNERGITLWSNMGKLFERIMNNRLTKTVKITDAKQVATADHLFNPEYYYQTTQEK